MKEKKLQCDNKIRVDYGEEGSHYVYCLLAVGHKGLCAFKIYFPTHKRIIEFNK